MLQLDNPVRPYAWGSRTAIAELQGRPVPTEAPEAELWMGAHPDDPSRVDGIGLDKYIEALAPAILGDECVQRFGARLPYLMKYLAAESPLSIQVHPNEQHARARFLAEERASFARNGSERIYLDPYHKPEMLVAHTRFEALCGFREPLEVAAEFSDLRLTMLNPVIAALADRDIRLALATLLAWPYSSRMADMAEVVGAGYALAPERADLLDRLAAVYPGDPGILVALMLRHEILQPGDALFVRPGQLHSYVSGSGVEIMASSDNVIRGGLTRKRVAVDELLATVSTDVAADPRLRSVALSAELTTWEVPVDDFRLHRIRHTTDAATSMAPSGPRLTFAVSGFVTVSDALGSVLLRRGEAAFGAADGGELRITGRGEVFVASL